MFDSGPDPTRPTEDAEFCEPTQPNPTRPMDGPDPRPPLGWLLVDW